MIRILLVGDVFGSVGRECLAEIKNLREDLGLNLVIVNAENIAHGKGINQSYYKLLLDYHVNVVTMGNHTFSNPTIHNFIDDANCLIRPLNFREGTPGKGYLTLNYNGTKITVFQVIGRTFDTNDYDCPFAVTEKMLQEVPSDIYICDFHGEATSEKIAFGLHFDGRVDCIVGTHTHVQTNDAHWLPKGTFYLTDLGMTGAYDGVIGLTPEPVIHRFMTGIPSRHVPLTSGRRQFSGLVIDINPSLKQKVTNYTLLHIVK